MVVDGWPRSPQAQQQGGVGRHHLNLMGQDELGLIPWNVSRSHQGPVVSLLSFPHRDHRGGQGGPDAVSVP